MIEKVMEALYDFNRDNFMYRKEAVFIVMGWGAFKKLWEECMKRGSGEIDNYIPENVRFRGLRIYRTDDIIDDQIKIG
jgi:hypothetical protein